MAQILFQRFQGIDDLRQYQEFDALGNQSLIGL
jgi:hypothetical protein